MISQNEYRKAKFDIFIESLNCKFTEIIEQGQFSTVLRVWNKDGEEGFAMKIVQEEDSVSKEREWIQLQHENILPLFDTGDSPTFQFTWFLSPVVELTLDDALKKPCLCEKYCKAFELVVLWIKEITSALNYIHKKELSFLNLKMSNVMISKDESVKIFGFHRLKKIGEFTTEYDVPDAFRPPESYSLLDGKLPVEGKAFDLWCIGVFSIEVLTGNYLARRVPDEACCWSHAIYPRMFKILQKNEFNRRCRSAFPRCSIKDNRLKLIRNFARGCLRLSPKLRPSTGTLLHHKLFEETGLLLQKDIIWKKELKPKEVRQKIKVMNFPLSSTEPKLRSEYIQMDVEHISSDDIDNVSVTTHSENVVLESEEEDFSVDQSLQNILKRSQDDNESFPGQVSYSVKTESADEVISSSLNLSSLNKMFDRIVVEYRQENLSCRYLHTETIVKTMRNFVDSKNKIGNKEKNPEDFDNVKFRHSSRRMQSLGYKITSKMFQIFI